MAKFDKVERWLPCLHCGGTDIRHDRHIDNRSPTGEWWSMCCYTCGATFPNRASLKPLMEAWNRRPCVSAASTREARLAEALKLVLDDWANANAIGDDAREQAEKALEGAPVSSASSTIPEGWKLVPVEPTDSMIHTFWAHYYAAKDRAALEVIAQNEAACAMIAAAPDAPVSATRTLDVLAGLMRDGETDVTISPPGNHSGGLGSWLVTMDSGRKHNFAPCFGDTLEEAINVAASLRGYDGTEER